MTTIREREQYENLLAQRGIAAMEESHYSTMSWSNRAKNAPKAAAAAKRYTELEAAVAAFEAAHPEVLTAASTEQSELADRVFNAGL